MTAAEMLQDPSSIAQLGRRVINYAKLSYTCTRIYLPQAFFVQTSAGDAFNILKGASRKMKSDDSIYSREMGC